MAIHLLPAALIGLVVLAQSPARPSADWPGLWGPSRNGETRAALPRTAGTLEVLWRRPAAGGFSEVAVRGGRAYTMEMRGADDFVVALDAATGREQWSVRVGPTFPGFNGSPAGPISTPALGDNDLFTLGPHGHLVALDIATGRERWRHDLRRDYDAKALDWGFAASPLIEGSLVIVPSGGSRGLLAFDRASGKLVWNAAVARNPAYASPVIATIGGVRQIVAASGDVVFGASPADGRVLWRAAGPGGEVANSPIVLPGDRVLVSKWEESLMIGVSRRDGAFASREIWRTPRLRSSNGPTVYHDGFLYGFAGNMLICMNAETTDVVWRERTGPGTLIGVNGHLVILGAESGEVLIAPVSSTGFKPSHRSPLLASGVTAVTGPSVANGRVYVRNIAEIVAFQLK